MGKVKLLLDTHTFIWAVSQDPRLPASTLAILADPLNERFLSSMSVYEMAIKIRLGKLDLKRPLDDFVNAGMRRSQITELPVLARRALASMKLPEIHKDPFDRLLIATAIDEDMALVSVDADVRSYPVKIVW